MPTQHKVHCECGSVEATLDEMPVTTGICHCEDCRELRQVPFLPVVAFENLDLQITKGKDDIITFQHPTKRMKRIYCKHCGETIYNTNAMGWKIVSQQLVMKSNNNLLPAVMQPQAHFFYSRRIIDINDSLPKIG